MRQTIRLLSVAIAAALFSAAIFAASDGVKQVNPKHICFMNKKRFDRSLKSVTIEGKTYYACCKDCLAKLTNDPAARMDVDPVSGKQVDKANAVIGQDKDGNIYFFENRENLRKFRTPASIPTGEQ